MLFSTFPLCRYSIYIYGRACAPRWDGSGRLPLPPTALGCPCRTSLLFIYRAPPAFCVRVSYPRGNVCSCSASPVSIGGGRGAPAYSARLSVAGNVSAAGVRRRSLLKCSTTCIMAAVIYGMQSRCRNFFYKFAKTYCNVLQYRIFYNSKLN